MYVGLIWNKLQCLCVQANEVRCLPVLHRCVSNCFWTTQKIHRIALLPLNVKYRQKSFSLSLVYWSSPFLLFYTQSGPNFLSPSVTIDSLYKVTEGGQSDIFHRHPEGSFDPACCFTVYHGNHMESLDLVTTNSDEARTWITGLRYLMAGISDEDSLAKRQRTHDQYPFNKNVQYVHGTTRSQWQEILWRYLV